MILCLLLVFTSVLNVLAEETQSSNYKIVGATFNSGGGESDAGSGDYRLFGSIGEVSDDRLSSGTYDAKPGSPNVLVANVPILDCFETVTDGSTLCTDVDVNPDGMSMLCGQGGCYDRARFEINIQNNPSDALYSIQIKEAGDPNWRFVDGSTFLVENLATHDINDYLTESAWEDSVSSFNILGLKPGTQYELRATALRGDFTESPPGPIVTATTAVPRILFDIDIDNNTGVTTESSSPYSVDLGVLVPGNVKLAEDLIWFDIGSNAFGGVDIRIQDNNTGLNSSANAYTIPSANGDLNLVTEGFGLQNYSITQTMLGPLTSEVDFSNGGDNVGGVLTTIQNIYNTSGAPIYEGRGAINIKAKSDTSTPAGDDYFDELTFTVVGSY